jgi:hypothetical protein
MNKCSNFKKYLYQPIEKDDEPRQGILRTPSLLVERINCQTDNVSPFNENSNDSEDKLLDVSSSLAKSKQNSFEVIFILLINK